MSRAERRRPTLPAAALIGVAGLALSAAAPVQAAPEVPSPFHGAWNTDLKNCDARGDAGGLTIWENIIANPGPAYRRIKALQATGPNEVAVTVPVMNRPGYLDAVTWRFRLSADGKQITQLTEGAPDVVRRKCPYREPPERIEMEFDFPVVLPAPNSPG